MQIVFMWEHIKFHRDAYSNEDPFKGGHPEMLSREGWKKIESGIWIKFEEIFLLTFKFPQ